MTLDGVDLLESGDERESRRLVPTLQAALAVRPPAWVVAVLVVAALSTLGAGLAGAAQVSAALDREAARVDVELRSDGSSSTTVDGVARGTLAVVLVNRRGNRAALERLEVVVEGLRATVPELGPPLEPFEQRPLRVPFLVPACDRLVLPGTLALSVRAPGQPLRRLELPVVDPREEGDGAAGIPLGACPPNARAGSPGEATDIGVRPAGGAARRAGAGAGGSVRLEIRNGGQPFRLLAVDARVPGVAFTPRVLQGGRTLETEELVLVRLAFTVPECSRLQPSGWVVLRIERFGSVQELGLRITAEPAAGLGPQLRLPVVLDACD